MDWMRRKRRAVTLYPMSLIFVSLIFLIGPGMLYNNFTASGLAPAQVLGTAGVCGTFAAGVPIDVTCQGTVNAGCQAQPGQCTLSGNTVSFLNNQSPFTSLIQGNIFGLFGAVNSNGNANRGPFDPNGGGQYYHADCFLNKVNGAPQNNITQNGFGGVIVSCTQTDASNANVTKANTFKVTAWNSNSTVFSTTVPPTVNFYQLKNNASYSIDCGHNMGYWYQTGQAQIGYSYFGCDFFKTTTGYSPPDNPAKTPIFSFILGVPCSVPGPNGCKAAMPSGAAYHVQVLVQPQSWETSWCVNAFDQTSLDQAKWYISQQCVNFETWFITPHTAGGFSGSGTANFGFFTPFLTILAGLILFLIGLGINIRAGGSIFGSGTTFGAGVNRQGTKLAQILGLGLIIYSFLYSEFSVWFTSGILPNGFDGPTGIVALTVGGIFFGGVMWQATQD